MHLSVPFKPQILLIRILLLLFGVELSVGQRNKETVTVSTVLPYSNLTSSSVEVIAHQQTPKPYALILSFVPLLTVFGNALVILAVYRERSLQTATNFLIVSLAVSDFMWNSFVWDLGPTLCNLFIGVDVACSTASILNLFSITLDRYMAISHPLAYTQYGTNNARAVLSICLVWGISIIVGLPVFFGANNKANEDSTELICEFNNAYFIIFSSLLSFFAPCAIMIVLYTVIFRRLKQKEKARTLRNLRRSRKSAALHIMSTPRLENEKISSALLTGARMARQMGNHFKTRADQMLLAMELSLQTSSFPTASPSLSEDIYASRINVEFFPNDLELPPTLLGSGFSRLSFCSLKQRQGGFLKRSNTVPLSPLSKSPFLIEKTPQVSRNNFPAAEISRKLDPEICNNVLDIKEPDKDPDVRPLPQMIKDISQMVEEAIHEGLSLASSPQPTKKWISFGENLYGSFPFIDNLSNRSDSLSEEGMDWSVAVSKASCGMGEKKRTANIQRHSSYCCDQEVSSNDHRARRMKLLNFETTPSLTSLPITQFNTEEIENFEENINFQESKCPISPNKQLSNGKIMLSAISPPAIKPTLSSTLYKRTTVSTKTRKAPIRMSISNGNIRVVVNQQLLLPIYSSPLMSQTLKRDYQHEPKSPSFCTSMEEGDESTINNPTTTTPTADNHKLSSTESLPNFNWNGLGWTQSSNRSNDSSTIPVVGGTTIVGDRSLRLMSTKSTRSQPTMTRDTNNNNKLKGTSKRSRTDSWQKAFRQCDEVWRRVTTSMNPLNSSLGQSLMLKGTNGGSRGRGSHRPSRQLIKKASKQMKREHKATVTLAVVLGVFLVCWVPFFTLHLTNAICMLIEGENCVHFLAMFLSTWLGYLNSSMNPLVNKLYGIFTYC